MNNFEAIKNAVKERDDFLLANPKYQYLQDEIDEVLKRAGKDKHNRQVALQQMMLNTWFKITEIL